MRVKTNDFVLQPTHSYTPLHSYTQSHSQSPTKPVAVISTSPPMCTSPTQPTPTATATSPPHSPSLDYRPASTSAATDGSGKGTVKSLRTSKPLGPRSSPGVGTSLSGRGDHHHLDRHDHDRHDLDHPDHDHPESTGQSGQGLHVEVEMYRDEGGKHDEEEHEEEEHEEDGGAHLAPFRAPSSASVSTSFSASTHTSSSKSGKRKSEALRRRGAAVGKEGGKYMQLEGRDGDERGHEESDKSEREQR